MGITQALSAGYLPATHVVVVNIEEMARLGTQAIFRARPMAMTSTVLAQMERRERNVLLLLNGNRTLQDVARLISRSELEVAYVLVWLLKRGFVEFLGAQQKSRKMLL